MFISRLISSLFLLWSFTFLKLISIFLSRFVLGTLWNHIWRSTVWSFCSSRFRFISTRCWFCSFGSFSPNPKPLWSFIFTACIVFLILIVTLFFVLRSVNRFTFSKSLLSFQVVLSQDFLIVLFTFHCIDELLFSQVILLIIVNPFSWSQVHQFHLLFILILVWLHFDPIWHLPILDQPIVVS